MSDVFKDHQWMPNTLFDMAAFCEANALEKPRDLLIEAALMLRLCLANPEINKIPGKVATDACGGMRM